MGTAPAMPTRNTMPADMQTRHDAFMKDMEERRAVAEKGRQNMPADMQARRDAFMKGVEQRRAENEKRREERMKKYNEVRTPAKSADNS